jgi:uncharacterized protein YjbJ (UPF0337 family)
MAGEQDIMIGKWNEVKGDMRKWWGKLTEDDWEAIKGQRDALLGRLQQRYGWSRMQAEEEYNRRMREYERVHTM